MDRQKEFVLRTLEERDIRFVRLWFTDVLGYLKSVAIAPAELEGAFEEGIGFDGSSIEGFARVSESDTVAHPDPSTFQVLPWESGGHHHSARMFCDITMPDGSPSWADPRHVLRRQLQKANDLGFSCYVHPEIEFFLLEPGSEDGTSPIPVDNAGYFDQAVHDSASNFRRHAIDALEFMGISVEFSHHEGAPGQQEIDLRFADALSMADNVMTFRYVIKEVAIENRARASFMPKPFARTPRLGDAHPHEPVRGRRQRLPQRRRPAAALGCRQVVHRRDPGARLRDQRGHQSVGQLLQAAGASAARLPPLRRGAPPTGPRLVRVPMYTPHKTSSRRIEVRSPDSACNPYLAFAVLLAAGLRGVEKGYVLGPQAEDNVWDLTPEERRTMGYRELPTSLDSALHAMETSELVAEALGEHVFDFFLRNKRAEWANYRSHVTPYELKTYLSL